MRDLATAHIGLSRLHGVIAFDRAMLGDPRCAPSTFSALYGALSAEFVKYTQAIDATLRTKEPT